VQYPEIDPIIFSIGPVAIRWYGMMYLAGFVFAMWLANRRASKVGSGWTKDNVSDLLFSCFLGLIIGARLGSVFFYQWQTFMDDPLYLFQIWKGGMSFHGGLLGVSAAMVWYARKNKRSLFAISDFIAPLVPFGLGAGRIANFINGELWGRTTDVPWAMVFPTGGPLARHPSQLYQFALEGLALLIILNWFIRKPRPVGAVSGLFLMMYGIFRILVEFVRQPDAQLGFYFEWLTMGQILSLPMVLLGAGLIWLSYQGKLPGTQVKKVSAKGDKK